jgi:hypothetical protein
MYKDFSSIYIYYCCSINKKNIFWIDLKQTEGIITHISIYIYAFNLRSGMPMPVYSSSIFFFWHMSKRKEERIALAFNRSNLYDVNIRLSLLRHINKKNNEWMNELIISGIGYILSSHMGATYICLCTHTRLLFGVNLW